MKTKTNAWAYRCKTVSERFWSKVNVNSDPGRCWEWTSSRLPKGYGLFHMGSSGTYCTKRSHRIAWELMYGSVTEGLYVLHHCDNPSCCNPYHLFLGTNKENSDDKVSKGRQSVKRSVIESSAKTKLCAESVRSIRNSAGIGIETPKQIAIRFGISRPQVYKIISRICWDWVE